MATKYALSLRNARSTALKTALDAGGAGAKMEVYTSPQPTNGGDAITTQTKLGTMTMAYPCGTVANGALTLDAVTPDSAADATGTINWVRVLTSADAFVMDLSAGVIGSQNPIEFNTLNAVAGAPIGISSGVITEGFA